jgi:hypothetical protein
MKTALLQPAYLSRHASTGCRLHFQHPLSPRLPPGDRYIPIQRLHRIPPHRTMMMTRGLTLISHVSTPTATQMTGIAQLPMCQIRKSNISLLLSRLKGRTTTIITSRSTVFKSWQLLAPFLLHQVTTNIQGSAFSIRLRSSITDCNLKQSAWTCVVVVVSFGVPCRLSAYEAETGINRDNDKQMRYVHWACRW